MNNANAIHNRFMRLALYIHKRQHGATVVVRRKVQVQADPETGQTQWQISQWKVPRVVVLPAKNQREVRQNAGAMAANRTIVQGSSLDTAGRHFIFDRRDVPPDLVLQKRRLDRLQQPSLRHRKHYGLRVRHGLAGHRQGAKGPGRSL